MSDSNIVVDEFFGPLELVSVFRDYEDGFRELINSFWSSSEFINWLFRGRCVVCGESSDVIHEINPRSSGQEAMEWKNRITLCNECHTEIHNKGTGEEEIKKLQERRIEFLEMIGRSEYV